MLMKQELQEFRIVYVGMHLTIIITCNHDHMFLHSHTRKSLSFTILKPDTSFEN